MIDGYSCWAAAINAAINSGDDLRIAVAEHAHEPGEHDQVGRMGVDALGERLVEAGAVGVGLVVDDRGGDAVRACELEPAGARPVADHRGDTRARDARTHDGFHIAAAAGNEDDDGLHGMLER